MARTLYLIRHGSVDANTERRYIGSKCNPSLNEAGRRQAQVLASSLALRPLGRLCASPLLRARETAEFIAAQAGQVTVEYLPELTEIDFGRWEGKTFPEIAAADPDLVSSWAECEEAFAFPEGESISAFLARTRETAEFLLQLPELEVGVVTHGGTLRAILCHCLGLQHRHHMIFKIEPCTVVTVCVRNGLGQIAAIETMG